jgi:hypothetical protein
MDHQVSHALGFDQRQTRQGFLKVRLCFHDTVGRFVDHLQPPHDGILSHFVLGEPLFADPINVPFDGRGTPSHVVEAFVDVDAAFLASFFGHNGRASANTSARTRAFSPSGV